MISCNSLACSCGYSDEFNLVDYDSYDYIFEVKIESKYTPNLDSLRKDTLGPPSLYVYNLQSGYNISLLEVFKGNLNKKIMSFSKGSSCSWSPEIGNTYIFYANYLGGVEMCNRKLVKEYSIENYIKEKSILQFLKSKPLEVKIKLNGNILIEGKHINKKRDGIWNIYSTNNENKIVFKLTYIEGELISVERGSGYSQENQWQSISYSYFIRQKRIKTKIQH